MSECGKIGKPDFAQDASETRRTTQDRGSQFRRATREFKRVLNGARRVRFCDAMSPDRPISVFGLHGPQRSQSSALPGLPTRIGTCHAPR